MAAPAPPGALGTAGGENVNLDRGICSVYHKRNTAGPGEKPVFKNQLIFQSWYGELSFETSSARPTESREIVQADARVRILQCREINNHDRAELAPRVDQSQPFEIIRAYHGRDEDSGELITDLTLRRLDP